VASFKSAFTTTTIEEFNGLNALKMEGVDLDLYIAMFKHPARKADLNLNSTASSVKGPQIRLKSRII